jgi:hypothetical protein
LRLDPVPPEGRPESKTEALELDVAVWRLESMGKVKLAKMASDVWDSAYTAADTAYT